MRRSPRALVLLLALAWSDKRDELRELHRQHRQHRHRPGVDAAAGAPPAPESDVPHLRARSQYIADALLRAPESAAPATPGAAAAAWRDQVEAHVAAHVARDFFAPAAAPAAAAAAGCAGVQVVGAFHKTGTVFANALVAGLARAHGLPSKAYVSDGGAVAHGNFSALAAPPGAAPGARFLAQACARARAVVLVRDPVDVVLSGFNYHARLPAPEAWLDWRGGLFANPCSDYMHAHSTLLRPAAPLVVSCTVGYFGHLVDNPNATYASLLRASSLGDGLRAEALRALVGSGDLLRQQLWVERALVDGSRHGPTFATMAGFYAPGQFAAVARCVFPRLDLPAETVAALALRKLRSAVLLEARGGGEKATAGEAFAAAHATANTYDKATQRDLLLGDAVVGRVLVSLSARLRALWASGKVAACGDFDAAPKRRPPPRWAMAAAGDAGI